MTGVPGTEASEYWDGHYGRRPQIWSGRPNGILVDEAHDLTPGRALDIGCGEGADAVWLAQQGWHVTAVDVSHVALERAVDVARAADVDELIDWQWHDLAHTFPDGTYDLVSAQYLHAPIEFPRDRVLRDAASAVAPGGTLLVVGHASPPPWSRHNHQHEELPQPDEVVRTLDLRVSAWVVDTCEVRTRETVDPHGEPATITDSVVKARRRR